MFHYINEIYNQLNQTMNNKLEHYYKSINGPYASTSLHKYVVSNYNNAKFVFVNSYNAKSVAYTGVEIYNQNKNIKIDIIDKGDDFFEYAAIHKNIQKIYRCVNDVYCFNSVEASHKYDNNSLDFVFLEKIDDDADAFDQCSAWWPKIKSGGILSGDDYTDSAMPGYVRGVNKYFGEICPDNITHSPNWFIVKK